MPIYGGSNPDKKLEKLALKMDHKVIQVKKDGNCLFRAVSKSLSLNYEIKISHRELRKNVITYLNNDRTFLTDYLEWLHPNLTQQQYLLNMAQDGEWGDLICVLSLSEILKVQFNILNLSFKNFIKVGKAYSKLLPLGFIDEYHYTALVPALLETQVKPSVPQVKPSVVPQVKPSVVPQVKPSVVPQVKPWVVPQVKPPSATPSIVPELPPPVFPPVKQLSSVNELLEIMDTVKPYVYDDISQLRKAEREIMVSLGM
ncbi:hypothetical protein DH26_gp031 [Chloriridovirus anopheles1]|uniref:OTU domain-containing protein n=1 Tax=Chloriridovirus anopheles1 TaxID=1465751 RepID=W8QMY0_9VIRU|nr:hypothetical protein DH26_gp031 [Anopheles minimus iridovirus]AHL67528.1 hypothetical protein AMIV_031 [Anopheles minimus iridovirus]